MAKCKSCPHKKHCQNECYGDNPCDFALAYDRFTRKVEARDGIIQKQGVEIDGLRKCSLAESRQMFGDYVLTPVQDPFTRKIGWWISKKGFTIARYCFTASDEKEVEYQVKNGLSGYMSLLDDTLGGVDAVGRIDRFLKSKRICSAGCDLQDEDICECVFDITLVAANLLQNHQIEVEDSRELFHFCMKVAKKFKAENYQIGDNYIDAIEDLAYSEIKSRFGKNGEIGGKARG